MSIFEFDEIHGANGFESGRLPETHETDVDDDDIEEAEWQTKLQSRYLDMDWTIRDRGKTRRELEALEEGNSYVYALWRPDRNEPFYIGIGQRERVFDHGTNSRGYNPIKDRIIAKIRRLGDDIEYSIPEINVTDQRAKFIEVELIAYIGRRQFKAGPLANMTDGGDGLLGLIKTDDHKAKITATNLETWQSQELRDACAERSRAMWQNQEIRDSIISKRRERHWDNPEWMQKLSEAKKAALVTYESRENLRQGAAKRAATPGYGEKISAAKKAQMCADVPENFPEILRQTRVAAGMNVSALARAIGINTTNISAYEHGKRTPSKESFAKLIEALPELQRNLESRHPLH